MFLTNKKLMKELTYQNEKLVQLEEKMHELIKIHLEVHDDFLDLRLMINEFKGLIAMSRAEFNRKSE